MHGFIHFLPLIGVGGYLKYPKDLRIPPTHLYYVSIIHNSALIVFSAWTTASVVAMLYKYGVVYQSGYYFQHADFDRIIYYFYLSKYYEFADTFLLYLQGKRPIFLQKYHHIGAVISWHVAYTYQIDCVWMPTLVNSFIHTIMYSYYLATLFKVNQVRKFKMYITTMQLAQFIMLMSYSMIKYYPPNETVFKYVLTQLFCNLYAFGLVVLFGKFYYTTYLAKIK